MTDEVLKRVRAEGARTHAPRDIFLLRGLRRLRPPRLEPDYCSALVAYRDIFTDALQSMAPTADATTPAPITFRWTPSRHFDAFADPRPDRRLIAISTDCWARLQGLANRLLSAWDLLSHIGEPESEPMDLQACEQNRRWLGSEPAPRCPVRREAACVIAEIALTLIFLHEYAHLALHHRDGAGAARLHERVRRLTGREHRPESGDRHQQEVEADCFATLAVLPGLRSGAGAFPNQIIADPVHLHLPSLGFVVLTLVNLCFAGRSLSPEAFAGASHPHPFVRLQAALGVSAGLSKIDPAVLTITWQPAADVFRLFQFVRHEPVTAEHWEHVSGPEGADAKSLAGAAIDALQREAALSALNAAAHGLLASGRESRYS